MLPFKVTSFAQASFPHERHNPRLAEETSNYVLQLHHWRKMECLLDSVQYNATGWIMHLPSHVIMELGVVIVSMDKKECVQLIN